jgi:hypothetical protein
MSSAISSCAACRSILGCTHVLRLSVWLRRCDKGTQAPCCHKQSTRCNKRLQSSPQPSPNLQKQLTNTRDQVKRVEMGDGNDVQDTDT